MSQVTVLNLHKIQTLNAVPTLSIAGTGADYLSLQLAPTGIDKNGVVKYRNLSASSPQLAEVVTFSSGQTGAKLSARVVAQIQEAYTDPVTGLPFVKPVTVDVRVASSTGHNSVNRRNVIVMAIEVLLAQLSDIQNGASPY